MMVKEMHDISLRKVYDNKESVSIVISDENKKKQIGFINYAINKEYRKWEKPELVGRIEDTLLKDEYHGLGIIEAIIDFVLCDMKCRGAEIVELSASHPKIWSRFGFQTDYPERYKGGERSGFVSMYRSISDIECECKSAAIEKDITDLDDFDEELGVYIDWKKGRHFNYPW